MGMAAALCSARDLGCWQIYNGASVAMGCAGAAVTGGHNSGLAQVLPREDHIRNHTIALNISVRTGAVKVELGFTTHTVLYTQIYPTDGFTLIRVEMPALGNERLSHAMSSRREILVVGAGGADFTLASLSIHPSVNPALALDGCAVQMLPTATAGGDTIVTVASGGLLARVPIKVWGGAVCVYVLRARAGGSTYTSWIPRFALCLYTSYSSAFQTVSAGMAPGQLALES